MDRLEGEGHPGAARHYGLDWLRIGAFALLILYHVGMVFAPWSWVVKSAHRSDAVAWLMLAINPWRLELLFLVSGYASRVLLAKLGDPGRFARIRSYRLLVPLSFAVMFVIPPQEWVRLQLWHGYHGGFWHFLAHDYFRFGTLDGVPLPNWEHLWFVAYLWAYTMLLCAGRALLPEAVPGRLNALLEKLGEGGRLLWLPLIWFMATRVALLFALPESHGLYWSGHATYLPAFLFGVGLAGTDRLWPAIARLWRPALVVALLGYAAILLVEIRYPGEAVPPHPIMALSRAARMAAMWGAVVALLHLAHCSLNHDHRLRAPLSEAVFPFYIMHQTAIVLIGWWLIGRSWSAPAEFALLLGGTGLACWLFYFAAARLGWARPLAGLSRRRRSEPAALRPVEEPA